MDNKEKKNILNWIRAWEETGKLMHELKQKRLANVDVQKAIMMLDDAFESARLHRDPHRSSGLVEMQKYFKKARK